MLNIFDLFYSCARPLIKWFLRHFTRLCELQRICYGTESGSKRKKAIERSLSLSRKQKIRELVKELDENAAAKIPVSEFQEVHVPHAITTILKVKRIKPKVHPGFGPALGTCIETIWCYRRLCVVVEDIRKMPFDSANTEHEEKLMKLWALLMPDHPLETRITKQWQDIGFQGDDPLTDFRGMGMLGLENLLYFAEEYNTAARHVLSHSIHPVHGYTFAIVGINLTSMAYNLLQQGAVKTHLYNLRASQLDLVHFHRLYCYLFYEFDKFWIACKPTSLMEFSSIYARFLNDILTQLNDDQTVFSMKQAFSI